MTRNETLKVMYSKANELLKSYTFDGYCEIWDMCYRWNDEHVEEEIFMCDYSDREDEVVNGFMIEDDYWTFEN